MSWKKGALIDDLLHCFTCMKKEVCKRRKNNTELGDIIFFIHEFYQAPNVREAKPKIEQRIENLEVKLTHLRGFL